MIRRTLALLFCACAAIAAPRVGEVPSSVSLNEKTGGLVAGGEWTSDSLKGKVRILFYVDPDEKELNAHVGEALKKEQFPDAAFGSVAIINLAATWKPNWVIGKALEANQKKYPRTIYVEDKERVLVSKWGLADNGYDIVLFDAAGKVRFYGTGKLPDDRVEALLDEIRKAIAEIPKE